MIKIKKIFTTDVSNLAHHNKRDDRASLSNVDLLYSTISEEWEIVGIADCSLYHNIDEKDRYKREYLIPKKIYEAPAGCAADEFILAYAYMNDTFIISNDRFLEYEEVSVEWLSKVQIKFMIIKNQLILQQPLKHYMAIHLNSDEKANAPKQFKRDILKMEGV